MAIKVLIADDDALIREGLKIILETDSGLNVVACVEDGLKTVEYCARNAVDVALIDVRMPVLNGVQATKEICQISDAKVIILTTFDDDEYIVDAIKNGARGYLLKSNTPEKIISAIKMVYDGNSVIQDVVLERLKVGISRKKSGFDKTLFSKREIEIMDLISKGLSNAEIAEKLFISRGTVKNYITSILSKTGLKHRTQIALYYIEGSDEVDDNISN